MRLVSPLSRLATLGLTGSVAALVGTSALGQALEEIGKPVSGGTSWQTPSSATAVQAHDLDNMLLYIITAITAFVTVLLLYVIVRYNAKRNPVAAKFTHNSPLEVAWTLIPILILVFIGSFSLPALFFQEQIPEAEVSIKVTGNQWYWSYEYPNAEDPASPVAFDSVLLEKDQLEAAGYQPEDYLLAVDNPLIVPVGKTVVVQITGADVSHAWFVPALAVQHSAVPGRLGQLWFKAEKEGVFYGQCTTLCGQGHAYMPIEVRVVSQERYDAWLEQAKAGNVTLAMN